MSTASSDVPVGGVSDGVPEHKALSKNASTKAGKDAASVSSQLDKTTPTVINSLQMFFIFVTVSKLQVNPNFKELSSVKVVVKCITI